MKKLSFKSFLLMTTLLNNDVWAMGEDLDKPEGNSAITCQPSVSESDSDSRRNRLIKFAEGLQEPARTDALKELGIFRILILEPKEKEQLKEAMENPTSMVKITGGQTKEAIGQRLFFLDQRDSKLAFRGQIVSLDLSDSHIDDELVELFIGTKFFKRRAFCFSTLYGFYYSNAWN